MLKIFAGFLALTLIVAVVAYVAYTETRPERRILVEENYVPPKRQQAAQPTPAPALQDTDETMTPMPGDE